MSYTVAQTERVQNEEAQQMAGALRMQSTFFRVSIYVFFVFFPTISCKGNATSGVSWLSHAGKSGILG